MKPQLHKLPFSSDSSFLYKKWECNYFDKPWHFHKEYELVLITKGRGKKFIGDHVGDFDEGCLSLIGSNVPHLFKNDEEFYIDSQKMEASSIFVHFTDDFLGSNFFNIPEMKAVDKLLKKSSLALEITGQIKNYTIDKLYEMNSENPEKRLMSLLDILIQLSNSQEVNPILSVGFTANKNGDTERINTVFEFILKNYTRQIYVEEIAEKLNMSVPSFSRYFKNHTRKTFSSYVTEIRITHACRLLMDNNHTISEVCYLSGFENLSNFYKHFNKSKSIIPKEYRSRFLKGSLTALLEWSTTILLLNYYNLAQVSNYYDTF